MVKGPYKNARGTVTGIMYVGRTKLISVQPNEPADIRAFYADELELYEPRRNKK